MAKSGKSAMDVNLLLAVVVLLVFGLIMVYSASSYEASLKFNQPTYYLKSQARATALGVVCMLVVSKIDYHFWRRFALASYVISLFLIILVRTPLGITRNGARRWLGVGNFSFQPAEAAKIAVILFVAALLCGREGPRINANMKKNIMAMAVIGGIPSLMLYKLTDNLSSAIIVFGIVVLMFFVATPKYWYFILGALLVLGLAGAVVWVIASGELPPDAGFRLSRIRAWLNPEAYASGTGYQTLQSLYSIGAGGIFGKGLGQSTQKLGFVPEAQNDMIFSIICEELGLFGATAILILFLILIWRFMVVANNAPDKFGALLVVGVMGHISIQVILNIAVVTNSIPNTGITLPFTSFGGTSVLFLLTEIGIALNVSRSIQI